MVETTVWPGWSTFVDPDGRPLPNAHRPRRPRSAAHAGALWAWAVLGQPGVHSTAIRRNMATPYPIPWTMFFDEKDEPIDALRALKTLSARWRGSPTLSYRSTILLSHEGELTLNAQIFVRLRRPNLARIIIDADSAEYSAIRVSNGYRVFHRPAATQLRPSKTVSEPLRGRIMENVPHPLDEASFSIDQFLAPDPFLPRPSLARGAWEFSGIRRKEKERTVFVVTMTAGSSRDTLTFDATDYSLIRLVRVGEHAGVVQQLLFEEFREMRLGDSFAPDLFAWSPADEAGKRR